jgi:hypothetical protein
MAVLGIRVALLIMPHPRNRGHCWTYGLLGLAQHEKYLLGPFGGPDLSSVTTHHNQPSGLRMPLTLLPCKRYSGMQAGRFEQASETSAVWILCRSYATLDSAAPVAGVVDALSCIASCQQSFLSE